MNLYQTIKFVFQEFGLCVTPFLFDVEMQEDRVFLNWDTLHSLLEEFLPPIYYSEWYTNLDDLLKAGRSFRICALTNSDRKLLVETLGTIKVGRYVSLCA